MSSTCISVPTPTTEITKITKPMPIKRRTCLLYTSRDTIWWTTPEYPNDNKPTSQETWRELKKIATEELSGKKLYVCLLYTSRCV